MQLASSVVPLGSIKGGGKEHLLSHSDVLVIFLCSSEICGSGSFIRLIERYTSRNDIVPLCVPSRLFNHGKLVLSKSDAAVSSGLAIHKGRLVDGVTSGNPVSAGNGAVAIRVKAVKEGFLNKSLKVFFLADSVIDIALKLFVHPVPILLGT
jgi:hypothetical protein